jgi:hypothetical protein
MKKIFLLVIAVLALSLPAAAQDAMTPAVEVSDQVVVDGMVTVSKVVSDGPGFMVIHADNGEGSFGPVIGFRWVNPGENFNVRVRIDAAAATSTLYAMLHLDDNEVGTYEFGEVEGADAPVVVDGAPVSPTFSATILNAHDQIIEGSTYTAASVTVDAPAWLVIHAGDAQSFGAVLGQTLLEPGTTADVAVELSADGLTPVLWPMLHVDSGEMGVYEFGEVEGADGPIIIGDGVAAAPVWTVPHMRIDPQIVTLGDNMEMMGEPKVTAKSVLIDQPGWLVIHADSEGGPGPVVGFAPLEAGMNMNVEVTLDAAGVTPNLFPMLHYDTGAMGTYEFGEVEGEDLPVRVNDNVVVSQLPAAPMILYNVTQSADGGTVTIPAALIDAPGWLVIHADNGGSPGAVAGFAPLLRGLNTNITITVDPAVMTENVFPMLHYDTGVAGVYEFGEVEGEDTPVSVGGNVVVGSAQVTTAE